MVDGGADVGSGSVQYSDGESARSEIVELRFGVAALSFQTADGTSHSWTYDQLFAEPSLGRRDREALIHPRGNPAETLWVKDQRSLGELRKRAPGVTTGRGTRKWLAIAAAIIVSVGALYALVQVSGLQPARTVAKMFPENSRRNLGDALVGSMIKRHGACVEPAGVAALNALVERFRPYQLSDEIPWRVKVVGWPIPNAFAAPGGAVVLTRGLLRDAQSPDEVAGVLAHELGHAQAMHPEVGIVRAVGMAAIIEFITGGSGGALATVGTNVILLGSSRNAERDADRRALDLLRKEGISPKGLADFFARLARKRGRLATGNRSKSSDGKTPPRQRPSGLGSLFSTHPGIAERVARIERAPTYPSEPALSPDQWQALKGICKAVRKEPES